MTLSAVFNFRHNCPENKLKLGLKYLYYHYLHCDYLEDDKKGMKAKYLPKNHNYLSLRSGSISCKELQNQSFSKKSIIFINIVLKDTWLSLSVPML